MKEVNFYALLLAVAVTLTCSEAARAANAKGWILSQSSQAWGHQNIELLPSQMKITFPDMNLVLLTKAPSWSFVLFNPQSKRYLEIAKADFVRLTSSSETDPRFMDCWLYRFIGNESIAGIESGHYQAQLYTRPLAALELKRYKGKSNISDLVVVQKNDPIPESFKHLKIGTRRKEVWVTTKICLPAELMTLFLGSNPVMPVKSGLPIRIIEFQRDGFKVKRLDTKAIKPAQLALMPALAPKGYQKVTSFTALTTRRQIADDPLEDLLDIPAPTTRAGNFDFKRKK